MTQHDPVTSLRQMLDFARRARSIAGQHTPDEIESDELLSLAIPRALELIGEAANRIPAAERGGYEAIDWRRIIDFRNVLIHGYERIDFRIVHEVLSNDIDPLISALEAILSETDAGQGGSG